MYEGKITSHSAVGWWAAYYDQFVFLPFAAGGESATLVTSVCFTQRGQTQFALRTHLLLARFTRLFSLPLTCKCTAVWLLVLTRTCGDVVSVAPTVISRKTHPATALW
jgi:hypothetical protein